MCVVSISFEEMLMASVGASIRQISVLSNGRVGNDHGHDSGRDIKTRLGDSWLGEIGEKAVSKYLDMRHTRGDLKIDSGDVGNVIEVRATEYQGGHLQIYRNDPDDVPFVLVAVDFHENGANAKLCGWIYGQEGKKESFWKDDLNNPCFWIDQNNLHSMASLKDKDKDDIPR